MAASGKQEFTFSNNEYVTYVKYGDEFPPCKVVVQLSNSMTTKRETGIPYPYLSETVYMYPPAEHIKGFFSKTNLYSYRDPDMPDYSNWDLVITGPLSDHIMVVADTLFEKMEKEIGKARKMRRTAASAYRKQYLV